MDIDLYELKNLFYDVGQMAITGSKIASGDLSPTLSKREAYRIYGEGIVKRWIEEGLITVRKDGNNTSKCRISRLEIEALAKANNRITYLSTAERQNKKQNGIRTIAVGRIVRI